MCAFSKTYYLWASPEVSALLGLGKKSYPAPRMPRLSGQAVSRWFWFHTNLDLSDNKFSFASVVSNTATECRRGGTKAAAYIKISEAEIADDYPEPTQYEKACLSVQNLASYEESLTRKCFYASDLKVQKHGQSQARQKQL